MGHFRSIWGHLKVIFSIWNFQIFNFSKSVRKYPQTIPKSPPNHPKSVPKLSKSLNFWSEEFGFVLIDFQCLFVFSEFWGSVWYVLRRISWNLLRNNCLYRCLIDFYVFLLRIYNVYFVFFRVPGFGLVRFASNILDFASKI